MIPGTAANMPAVMTSGTGRIEILIKDGADLRVYPGI